MTLGDKLRRVGRSAPIYPSEFEVFKPLLQCAGKPVFIASYGLSDSFKMREVIEVLSMASSVSILIGYSKKTHDLVGLKEIAADYWNRFGWSIRALPSCHLKIWTVGDKAWVGSANFSPSTLVNRMWKVPFGQVRDVCNLYWNQAAAFSKTTDLFLVPQAKIHGTNDL